MNNKEKIEGLSTVIAFIIATLACAVGLGLLFTIKTKLPEPEVIPSKVVISDSIMSENKDSLAAFMSIIIEANHKLVDNPEQCRNLVLVDMEQPCYIEVKDKDLVWIKPLNKSVTIWIPTDKKTWLWSEPGLDLSDADSLCIGSDFYVGDLNRVSMTIVKKEDRGF